MGPKLLIALLSLVVSTISVPTEVQIEGRALNCKVVDAVINYFTRYTAQASSFCTAYLQTTTTIAVTVPRATKTINATRQPCPVSSVPWRLNPNGQQVTTGGVTGTVTVTDYTTAVNTFVKRDGSVPRPTWLPNAIAANLVSSACSCYVPSPPAKTAKTSITTGTTTVTVTKSAAAATQTVTVPIYCGVAGALIPQYDSKGDPIFLASGSPYTLQQCKALCMSEPTCLTFTFDTDIMSCTTVAYTIAGNFDPGSSFLDMQFNYDRNCDV